MRQAIKNRIKNIESNVVLTKPESKRIPCFDNGIDHNFLNLMRYLIPYITDNTICDLKTFTIYAKEWVEKHGFYILESDFEDIYLGQLKVINDLKDD